jgi:hypothetical protein
LIFSCTVGGFPLVHAIVRITIYTVVHDEIISLQAPLDNLLVLLFGNFVVYVCIFSGL